MQFGLFENIMMGIILALGMLYFHNKFLDRYSKGKAKKECFGLKEVPEADGALPVVGHALSLGTDIISFIRKAYSKHGKIFKIRVFSNEMVILCDRLMIKEYFEAKEDQMSMYEVTEDLYLGEAFSDKGSSLYRTIRLIRKTIAVRSEEFAPKIFLEAEKLIERMKEKARLNPSKPVNLAKEAAKFMSSTSARCFMSIELPDDLFDDLYIFTQLLNLIVKLTSCLPKWFIRLVFNPLLRRYRVRVRNFLSPEIEKYRKDPKKNDSRVFRECVDDSEALTNDQISDVVLCLLYVSTENTALGLANCLIDLGCHRSYWDRVKEETEKFLKEKDYKGLFSCPLLDACVMESARLNSHVFALQRRPKSQVTLGGYYIGNVYSVALCEPMLMSLDCAGDKFTDPTRYEPDRFIKGIDGNPKESKNSTEVLTWGSGVHHCPGSTFSIYEIKAALTMIVSTFRYLDLKEENIGKRDMLSPSAFAERHVPIPLRPLSETTI